MYYAGCLTEYRLLASYKDPKTGRQRRKSVTRKTKLEVEGALQALLRQLPKTTEKRSRTGSSCVLPSPTGHEHDVVRARG